MADLSESDYGMWDYGDGYYSTRPIYLFESSVRIPINVDSILDVVEVVDFMANAVISVYKKSDISVWRRFQAGVRIQFFVQSTGSLYNQFSASANIPFSTADTLALDIRFASDFSVQFDVQSAEYLGKYWNPIAPEEPAVPVDNPWSPIVDAGSGWNPETPGEGPWTPWGPSLKPNKPWLT